MILFTFNQMQFSASYFLRTGNLRLKTLDSLEGWQVSMTPDNLRTVRDKRQTKVGTLTAQPFIFNLTAQIFIANTNFSKDWDFQRECKEMLSFLFESIKSSLIPLFKREDIH